METRPLSSLGKDYLKSFSCICLFAVHIDEALRVEALVRSLGKPIYLIETFGESET